ncbi:hypothetical protein T484DRAFT_1809669, partial [Baffinella frigidus]
EEQEEEGEHVSAEKSLAWYKQLQKKHLPPEEAERISKLDPQLVDIHDRITGMAVTHGKEMLVLKQETEQLQRLKETVQLRNAQ